MSVTGPIMQAGGPCPIIIIGSSTGGPQVLEEIFSRVVRVPAAAIIIVQHLSHSFVPLLGVHIHEACGAPVVIPSDGDSACSGTIYLAPAGRHLMLRNNRVFSFSDAEKVNGVRPSIDSTMRSLLPGLGGRCMSILLTGMGVDGAKGTDHIKKNGGVTVVQDPGTCAIRSMPLAAIATGSVDYILPPDAIAVMINQ
ncbi:MAG: chemotaxis protein CheB, partial [Methanomicrobiales archaeon]|nr:chemotaxis protein CheB [Methanomicrobiales archaeon]